MTATAPSTVAPPADDDVAVESPDLLGEMRSLASLVEAHAAGNEAAVTLRHEVVEALHDRTLFRILAPACLGGFELPVRAAYEIIEEASRADGATGWSLMAGAIYLAVAGA